MESFNRELFLMDVEKINLNPDKIKFVVETLSSVQNYKMKLIQEQKFESAAEWRQTERWLNNDILQDLINNEDSNIVKSIES